MNINTNDECAQTLKEKIIETFKEKRCYQAVLVMSAVGEVVTLVILVVYLRGQRYINLASKQGNICYPRHILVSGDDGNVTCPKALTLKTNETEKTPYCCGNMSDVLNSALNKTVEDRYDSDTNPEMVFFDLTEFSCSSSKHEIPKLRLSLAPEKKSVPEGFYNFKLSWKKDSSLAANSGLRFIENKGLVVVMETGFFLVSSQLNFKFDTISDDRIGHFLHLLSGNNTISTLLEYSLTPCNVVPTDSAETASLIEAPFHLKDGDRLFVTTSHPGNILHENQNNYFNIYKL